MQLDPFIRLGGIAALLALLTACDQAETAESPTLPQVTTVVLSPGRLELSEDLPGRVAPLRMAEIRPQISGIVQQRLFEQGGEVRAGQALFRINPAPLMAERDTALAALQRAEAVLARAQLQAQRLEPLVQADAISRQVYDDAVSQREQAAADVAQARATLQRKKLELKYATVDAPISGRIDQALVTEGALVSSNDASPMARIQQIDKVYVDVRRPAASLEALQQALGNRDGNGQSGLPVTLLRSDGTAYETKGRILFSGINVDAGTGDVLLRVQVDNPKRQLLPGMYVRARVPLAHYSNALTLPQQAVIHSAGKTQVWTVDGHNKAHLTPVRVGELVNRHYRVVAGLIKGQQVVVEGMDRLSDGAQLAVRRYFAPAQPLAD